MWVFLSGYGGSGKSTAAHWIAEKFGLDKASFADGVREAAAKENRHFPELDTTYRQLLEDVGYAKAKEHQCVRDYLVEIGHGHREKYGEFVWINILNDWLTERPHGGFERGLALDDCRYSNEEAYGRASRGERFLEIMIERPGCLAKHETEEISLKGLTPDHVIVNDGTKEEFLKKLEDIVVPFERNLRTL